MPDYATTKEALNGLLKKATEKEDIDALASCLSALEEAENTEKALLEKTAGLAEAYKQAILATPTQSKEKPSEADDTPKKPDLDEIINKHFKEVKQ